MKKIQYIIIGIALFLISVVTNAQTVYTVTKTTDPDPFEHPFNYIDSLCDPEMYGTLQWAINKVNSNSGEAVIDFDIVGTGVQEIILNSYLPQIRNNVTINGTKQNGYSPDEPKIKITGQMLSERCFNAYNNSINIEGIWFANFSNIVFDFHKVRDSEIKNNIVTHMINTSKNSFVFALGGCENIVFYNNIIKNELNDPESRYYTYGFYFKSSNNMTVGGTEEGQANTITNCKTALFLGDSQHIKISGNRIYNNDFAMEFLYGSNNDIDPPIINAYYADGVLKGEALPNSTIEVFGSTGPENANEYLVSTVADGDGEWGMELSTSFPFIATTQTDLLHNTSQFAYNRGDYGPQIVFDTTGHNGIVSIDTIIWHHPDDPYMPYYANYITVCQDAEPITFYSVHNYYHLQAGYPPYSITYWCGDCLEYFSSAGTCTPEGIQLSEPCNTNTDYVFDPTYGDIAVFYPELNEPGVYIINGQFASDLFYMQRTYIEILEYPDATITPVEPICENAFPINLTAATPGGVWSGNGVTNLPTGGTFNPSGLEVGTHQIIYSIDDECPASDTIYIVVLSIPVITPINDGPVCEGFPVNFSISSDTTGLTYQWFSNTGYEIDNPTYSGFTIPVAQVTNSGSYTVTVTDENGCTNEAETILDVYPNPIVEIMPPNPVVCNGEPIILYTQGQGQIIGYEWSTGETTPIISIDQGNTSYSVTVIDEHECIGTDTIFVTESNIEIDLIFSTNTCENSNEGTISVQASGGSEPYTYVWTGPGSFSANTSTITNLYPGQYNLTVTDDAQCSITETYIVEELEIPELEITEDIICTGTNDGVITVSVTNMSGPFTYLWSGGQNSATIINQPAGNYSVTVTAANECSATISTYIDNYPVPEVTITPSETIICNMVPITLDAGNGWSSYHWSTGDDTQIIEVHTPDADYSVTITDIHGCVGIDTIHIEGSNLAIKDPVVVHTCEGQNDGSISQTIVGGDEPLDFEWTGPDDFTADTEDISNLFAGVYFFTVTDANGCFLNEMYIVEDFENPDLTISSDYVCNNENTGSLEVGVTNLTGPFDVLWSNNETTFIIANQAPGEYTVTVTDIQSGCSASISSLIDNYSVDASFSLNDDCLDLDRIGNQYFDLNFDFEYTAIDWQNYDFYWDLGNGTIGTELTVPVDYALDGYYCVTATVSREECFSTVSDIVYVYPNRCYCIETEWDTGFYTDYTLQETDEYWGGIFRRIRGQIIVPNGHTLTLHKCDLAFGTNGGITVEQGGTLIVSQTKMTSKGMGSCDGMWQGIEVHGQWGLPVEQQGNVRFINGGNIIENAHIGILLGERNVDYVCNPQINPELGPFNTQGSCGWVEANNVEFVNNGTDISFIRPEGANNIYINSSIITACDFTCGELIDQSYSSDFYDHYGNAYHPFGVNAINTRNPWAGGHNELQRTTQSIWAENQRFLQGFALNTFENKEIGIEIFNARMYVYKSEFIDNNFGINIGQTMSTIYTGCKIENNIFQTSPTYPATTFAYIANTGGRYDLIKDNKFGEENASQNNTEYGIYLRGASNFNISENDFNRLLTGVFVGSSGNNGGDIKAGLSEVHIDWRGNEFTECKTNILTRGSNSHLRLKCNNCNNITNSLYTVNFENIGILANQGIYLPLVAQQQTWGAGNEFVDDDELNPAPISRRVKTNNTYTYTHHSNTKTTPVLYPGSSAINFNNMQIPKAINSVACPTLSVGPDFPINPIFPIIQPIPPIIEFLPIREDIIDEITRLKLEYNNLILSLDNGVTQELLTDISKPMANGKLKNKLIANSPLSDTVLISLLIEYPLSHGNFKQVMELNMPTSHEVEPFLFARLETIPQGIYNQLINLQSVNPNAITSTSIKRQIDYWEKERVLLVNEVISILLDTAVYKPDYVKQILVSENNLESKQLLISTEIAEGDFISALEIINEIDPVTQEISDWIQYHQILLSLFLEDKSIYSMDSAQIAFVFEQAYKCPEDYTSANAQALLGLLYGIEIPVCMEMSNRSSRILVNEVDFTAPEGESFILDNFPNPFTDNIYVDYYLSDDNNGEIVIIDIYGRIIDHFDLENGENTLIIETKDLQPGVYSLSLYINGKHEGYRKMVKTQ